MPWFLPVLALAAAAAGTGMQMAAANKQQKEANNRISAELQRQKALQQQADAQYQVAKQQSDFGDAQSGIKQGGNERQAAYEAIQQMPIALSQPGTQIGKSVVTARDAASLDLSNRTRAALAGYDQWMLQRMIEQQQSGQLLGLTGGLARSSGGVLPYELQSAQNAGANLAGAGGMLSMLGNLGSNYSASQGQWFTNAGKTPSSKVGPEMGGTAPYVNI